MTDIKVYSSKSDKVTKLCKLLGLENSGRDLVSHRKSRIHNPKTLRELSSDFVSKKVPKACLNIVWAEYIWPRKLSIWKDSSPVQDTVKVGDSEYPDFLLYHPEFSERRGQLEVRCIDSSHLLTRIRRKCCKGGLENISQKPCIDVAHSQKTFLASIMVEDLVDPMSVPMAVSNFQKDVEECIIELGYNKSAFLCHDVREWWGSEDEPGIAASDRINMRKRICSRLVQYVDFLAFLLWLLT